MNCFVVAEDVDIRVSVEVAVDAVLFVKLGDVALNAAFVISSKSSGSILGVVVDLIFRKVIMIVNARQKHLNNEGILDISYSWDMKRLDVPMFCILSE
jgi:hypothetical protein